MVRSLIAVILLALIAYGSLEAWPLIIGPSLLVSTPIDQESFPGGVVTIQGKAARIVALTLNSAALPHTEQGVFETALSFPQGGSILTFIATDRFGRRITITRTLYVP